MLAQVEILNVDGKVLLSEQDPCLQLVSKSVVTQVSGQPNPTLTFTNVTNPVIAIKSLRMAFVRSIKRSGSTITVEISASVNISNPNVSVTVYYFDVPKTPSQNGVGIQLFNSSGVCTFNATEKTAVLSTVLSQSGQWTGTPGREYAVCFYSQYVRIQNVPVGGNQYSRRVYNNAASVNGNVVEYTSNGLWSSLTLSGNLRTDISSGVAGAMVLDVTSY